MTPEGKWFNVRIMPYRTTDDHIDGLVMTFYRYLINQKSWNLN